MLDAELAKDLKKPPEIEYYIPKKIFRECDVDSAQKDGLVVELCGFT